jgi:hypothetical protein
VNINRKENRISLQILFISILCIGLLLIVYAMGFRRSPLDAEVRQEANSTKTALALTADSLLGPFPTSTAPTPTASDTPTLTPTIPTATPTITRTLTPTRTLIPTFTPRTQQPRPTGTGTAIAAPPTFRPSATTAPILPTNTSIPPTNPPPDTNTPEPPPPPTEQPTNPPQPTDIIDVIKTLLPPVP